MTRNSRKLSIGGLVTLAKVLSGRVALSGRLLVRQETADAVSSPHQNASALSPSSGHRRRGFVQGVFDGVPAALTAAQFVAGKQAPFSSDIAKRFVPVSLILPELHSPKGRMTRRACPFDFGTPNHFCLLRYRPASTDAGPTRALCRNVQFRLVLAAPCPASEPAISSVSGDDENASGAGRCGQRRRKLPSGPSVIASALRGPIPRLHHGVAVGYMSRATACGSSTACL